MQAFLDDQGCVVAPVTFDNADCMFAALYTRPEFRDRVRQEYVPYMESVVASFEAAALALAGRSRSPPSGSARRGPHASVHGRGHGRPQETSSDRSRAVAR